MIFGMVYKSGQIFLPFYHNSRMWQTDGWTDRQTEFSSLDCGCIPCSAVKSCILTSRSRLESYKRLVSVSSEERTALLEPPNGLEI